MVNIYHIFRMSVKSFQECHHQVSGRIKKKHVSSSVKEAHLQDKENAHQTVNIWHWCKQSNDDISGTRSVYCLPFDHLSVIPYLIVNPFSCVSLSILTWLQMQKTSLILWLTVNAGLRWNEKRRFKQFSFIGTPSPQTHPRPAHM